MHDRGDRIPRIMLAELETARGVDTPESMPGQEGGKSIPRILPTSQMRLSQGLAYIPLISMRIMLLNC